MKRLSLILALLLCFGLCSIARAEGEEPAPEVFTSGDYTYILLEYGTAEITKYSGKESDLVIPSVLDGVPVMRIGDSAFSMRFSLTSVIISNGITTIGDHAFYLCTHLTSVTISDSVTTVCDGAFSGCKSLTGVTVPDSVTSMGINPFSYCEKLTSLQVSPNHPVFASIDNVLFDMVASKLICYPKGKIEDSYAIPQGIQVIGDHAFSYCDRLTSITISDSVTTIGESAFSNCGSLISVIIPDGVTTIDHSAFYRCPDLTVTVGRDSYAAQYCQDNGIPFVYSESLDGLNPGV